MPPSRLSGKSRNPGIPALFNAAVSLPFWIPAQGRNDGVTLVLQSQIIG